jgi:hypothetical protein
MPSIGSTFQTFASTSRQYNLANYNWDSPSSAKFSDNAYASFTYNGPFGFDPISGTGATFAYFDATNLYLKVPTGATINGIGVSIERQGSFAEGNIDVYDDHIYLIYNGSTLGNNKSAAASWSDSVDQVDKFPSSGTDSDLWGASLTATIVNSTSFGVRIGAKATYNGQTISGYPKIDQVSVVVFYTGGAALGQTISNQTAIITRQNVPTGHRVVPLEAPIRPQTIGTKQNVTTSNLVATVKVLPSSVFTAQNNPRATISAGISTVVGIRSIFTAQNTPRQTLIPGVSKIYPVSVNTYQNIVINSVSGVGTGRITTTPIITRQNVTSLIIYNIATLRPSSIISNQNVTRSNIFAQINILPTSLLSKQNIANQIINSNITTIPSSIFTKQNLTNVRFTGSVTLFPSSILTNQNTTLQRLQVPNGILRPSSINTVQSVFMYQVSAGQVIYPIGLASKQIFTGIGLSAGNSNILPRSINSNQNNPNTIVNSNLLVKPLSVYTKQDVILQTVKGVIASILPSSILRKDNTPIQKISGGNSNILPSSIITKQEFTTNRLSTGELIIRPQSVLSRENTPRLVVNIGTVTLGVIAIITKQRLNLPTILSITNLSVRPIYTGQINSNIVVRPGSINILPPSVLSNQIFTRNLLIGGPQVIIPRNIFTKQSLPIISLTLAGTSINPSSIFTAQRTPNPLVKSVTAMVVQAITTNQNAPSINLTNRFYDRMDTGGSFTLGDTSSYNLQTTDALGVYSYERPASVLPGYKTLIYQYVQPRGSTFYYSAWVKTNSDYASNGAVSGLSAVGVGIQPSNLNNGYFATIDVRNGTLASQAAFQLRINNSGTSILAFDNRSGLIQAGQWYKISIYWDSTGLIQAYLFNSSGYFVSRISATDSTYTTGYLGVSSFSSSMFDNFTNISELFILFDNASYAINSRQNVPQQSLATQAFKIFPGTIYTKQNIAPIVVRGSYNILPSTITSRQLFGSINLYAASTIIPRNILSRQLFGLPLLANTGQIVPSSIVTRQTFGNIILNPSNVNIIPNVINSKQLFTNITINSLSTILPSAIRTKQLFGSINIYSNVNIQPTSILTKQLFGLPLISSANPAIIPNSIITRQNIGSITIVPSTFIITPSAITTKQILGPIIVRPGSLTIIPRNIYTNQIFTPLRIQIGGTILQVGAIYTNQIIAPIKIVPGIVNIIPSSILTKQDVTLPSLTKGVINISPISVRTAQNIAPIIIKSVANIYPTSIITKQFIANINIVSTINIIPSIIATNQRFGQIRIISESTLRPGAILSNQLFGPIRLYSIATIIPTSILSRQTFGSININNINPIIPFAITTRQNFGSINLLPGTVYITPIQILSKENIPTTIRLRTDVNIQIRGIGSKQLFGSIVLYSNAYITPISIYTSQVVPPSLSALAFITPSNIYSAQNIPRDHRVSSDIKIIPPYIATKQNVPSLHRIGFTSIIKPVSIYTLQRIGLPKLRIDFTIQPFFIRSKQNVPRNHKIVVPTSDGYITAWFEVPQRIKVYMEVFMKSSFEKKEDIK